MDCNCFELGRRGMSIYVTILGCALLTVLIIYHVLGDSNDLEDLRKLRMIAIISRHGHRAPYLQYANDPYKYYKWHGGLGALSPKGCLQVYNLGKNLNRRYYRLLPSDGFYTRELINVKTSYKERCIMSAQCLMAGFMPPLQNKNPLPIPWQPVAMRDLPREQDYLIVDEKPCPKYDIEIEKLLSNPPPSIKELNNKNRELYEYVTLHSGENITNLIDLGYLYDTLYIENLANLKLPSWTDKVFPDKLMPLTMRGMMMPTETQYMKHIMGGPLVTEIAHNMVLKRSNQLDPNRNIFLYSGHDMTLINVMNTLDLFSQVSELPEFASAMVFELHHSATFVDDYEVKIVYYYNGDDKFPSEITIPNCGNPCSLTEFQKSIKSVEVKSVEQYDELCKIK